jgi:hypothetical protein
MRRLILVVLLVAACKSVGAPLPITLRVTTQQAGLLPPGRPVQVVAEIDFGHDQPLQSVRLYVSGVHADTFILEERIWAADMRRPVTIELPLEPLEGPLYLQLQARIGDLQVRSDTLTLTIGDVEAPRINLSPPPTALTPNHPVNVGFSASDNSGLVRAEAIFSGAWEARIDLVPAGRTQMHAPFTVKVPTGPVPGDTIDMAIIAEDVTGNADTSRWAFQIVDPLPPTMVMSLPNARGIMNVVIQGVGVVGRLHTVLASDEMVTRVQLADGVGLSHVVLRNPLLGRADTIMVRGLSADTFFSAPTGGSEARRGWLVAEAHDLGGNVRIDSIAAGIYPARVPPMEAPPTSVRFPVFSPDGLQFLASGAPSGPLSLFALHPLRLVRALPLASSAWGADFTASGDSIAAAGSSAVGLIVGPTDGEAADFTSIPLTGTDQPRFVAVHADGRIGTTAARSFPTVAHYLISPSGAVAEVGGGTDSRVGRPHSRRYILFGDGALIEGDAPSFDRINLPPGGLSFNADGTLILAGASLYDDDGNHLVYFTIPSEPISIWRGAPTSSALWPDGTHAYLGFTTDPEVLLVRLSDMAVVDRLLLPLMPTDLVLSPDGVTMIVTAASDARVIDLR